MSQFSNSALGVQMTQACNDPVAPLPVVAIPAGTLEELVAYLNERRPPSKFLWAVLSNDLHRAVIFADPANKAALVKLVLHLHNHIPSGAWGSPERMQTWLDGTTANRTEARKKP